MHKLPKTKIILESEDISRTLKSKSTLTKHLAFYKNTSQCNVSRIGLAIPKKNAKRAVDRNRIKRLVRETFRQAAIEEPTDIVVKLIIPIGKKTRRRLRESERKLIRQQLKDHFQIN